MHATKGDQLIIQGHHAGEPGRGAEIIEVRGPHGAPPYIDRWGRHRVFLPGSDAWSSISSNPGGTGNGGNGDPVGGQVEPGDICERQKHTAGR